MSNLAAIFVEIGIIVGSLTPLMVLILCLTNGIKCLLRSDMLSIYYHNRESETIRQYELENFVLLYNAYKALRGNSFIDKIKNDVMKWEVIT